MAYILFLRNPPHEEIPKLDRRLAPVLAPGIIGTLGLTVACFQVAYPLNREV